MRNDEVKGDYSGNNSTEMETIIGSDRTLGAPVRRTSRKSSGNSINEEAKVELTIEIREESVTVQSVQTVGGGHEDPELTLLAKKTLEKKSSFSSSFGSSLLRSASENIIRQVSQEFKRLASLTRKTSSTSKRLEQAKSAAVHALKGLKFITKEIGGEKNDWAAVEKRFDKLTASTNGLLLFSKFGECIGMKNDSKEFASELFRALARKHSISGDLICCTINKEQLKEFWDRISDESFDSRLKTFFDMIDRDADGNITKEEVTKIISLSASTNKLSNIQKQAEEYAAFIMEVLDPDQVGHIKVHSLEALLLQAPDQSVRKGDRQSLIQLLSQELEPTRESNPLRRWYKKIKYLLMDNWQRVWIVMLWFGIVSGLFVYKFLQYRRNKDAYDVMGYCVCTAKGGAETLKFNMALILLPVCRNTITWLRNKTKLGLAVPFDDNLNFHKVIATGIAIGVILHGGAHLACDFPRLIHASEEKYKPMKPYFGEEQPENYWWFLKQVEGATGIIMVVLMALAFTLANSWFRRDKLKNMPKVFKRLTGYNAFWYSHHLFVIVYALLTIHGFFLYLTKTWYQKTTWMYLAVPVLLYVCERLITFRSNFKPVEILKVVVYPEKVLALHLCKPNGFKYKSGQYMFVKCATISHFQWHPFSITSAPGDNDLSVHIRILGDWTGQLNTVFSKLSHPAPTGRSGVRIAVRGSSDPDDFPRISIDGPYGAPAQDYKKYDVVLLIGLGIGATPMISIVKDIISNMEKDDSNLESALENGTANKIIRNNNKSSSPFKTKKAYMYWVTREQPSFEWFREIMDEVAEMDKERVIELHNYCTSVYEEGDARSAIISMLQSLHHAKNGMDVVSETRIKSHFAKPNWRQVFKEITLLHPESKIGVFYCGLPAAKKEIRQVALEFNHKSSTKFDFHNENF